MANNRELADQANQLGKRLGVPVNTEGLSSNALQTLVNDLQAQADQQVNAATSNTVIGDPRPRSREPNKPNDQPSLAERIDADRRSGEAQRGQYTVAPGRSVISGQRGSLDAGQEIRVEDVGGQEALDRLVQKGVVVRGADQPQQPQQQPNTAAMPSGTATQVQPQPQPPPEGERHRGRS